MKLSRKFYSFIPVFFSLIILCGPLYSCSMGNRTANSEYLKDSGMVWNTQYNIIYAGPESFADSVRMLLDNLGKTFSVFDSASLVSRVNLNDSTPVNTDFIRVYITAKKIWKLSDGAFDPTLSPVIDAWGFGPHHAISADTLRIDSLMQFVGMQKTHLRNDAIVKDDSRTSFNFSAIAKGYACDRIAEMFLSNGIEDFLIEIGGEIRAAGKNKEGTDWRISIDKPVISDSIIHESQAIINLTDMGMATSGNYRNYKRLENQIIGHTISAKTGRPVVTDVLSASVLCRDAAMADALATTCMALGSVEAIRLSEMGKFPLMLVTADSVWMSDNFKQLIVNE